jgi:putative lipase involved disintegration of autophagic bodies
VALTVIPTRTTLGRTERSKIEDRSLLSAACSLLSAAYSLLSACCLQTAICRRGVLALNLTISKDLRTVHCELLRFLR